MNIEYNVYCDESCHLENDGINAMTLGAVWVPKDSVAEISKEIREIKQKYSKNPKQEAKWTRVSYVERELYIELVNYFFNREDLMFRCVLVPNKFALDHKRFNQTHDEWYYKMYYATLSYIFDKKNRFNVYIDIKDTNSYKRSQKLLDVCSHALYDSHKEIIKKIQPIRSDEVELMQIVDILAGAVAYDNRKFDEAHSFNKTKKEIIELIKYKSENNLRRTSYLKEEKFNLFIWSPQ